MEEINIFNPLPTPDYRPTSEIEAEIKDKKDRIKREKDELNRQNKWHKRFIEMAYLVSSWSKDPSTQCGTVIVDKNNRVVSVGYNGFARGVEDTQERLNNRELKYPIVIHSEPNALMFAKQDLTGCSIYFVPMFSCARCSALIIQAGIKKVYYVPTTDKEKLARWGKEFELSSQMYKEAGVLVTPIEIEA